jgi:hypothetical protein
MKSPKALVYLLGFVPFFAFGQIKGYRTVEKLLYAYADSSAAGKGKYYPLAPLSFVGDSSVTIVYTNDTVFLHDIFSLFTSSVNDIELVSEERHHYYVYAKDSSYGYDWNGYKEHRNMILRRSIDTVLGRNWTTGFISQFESFLTLNPMTLVSSRQNADSSSLLEIHQGALQSDTCALSTVYINYTADKNKGIPSTLNKTGMYITDIRIVTECRPCKFEISYHMQPVTVIPDKIARIFQAYINNQLEARDSESSTSGSW